MRPATQIDEVALPIQRDVLLGRDTVDNLGFVFFTHLSKEFDRFVSLPDFTLNRLVTVDDLPHSFFNGFEVGVGERFRPREIVIKSVFDGRPDGYLRVRPQFLDGFGKYVRRIVAQQFKPGIRITSNNLDLCILVDRAGQIPFVAVDTHSDGHARQTGTDRCRDFRTVSGVVKAAF